jgi:ATP-dependent DNA helicase RecG
VYSCDGRFLIRQDTENKALTPRDLRRMFIQRGDLSFETEIAGRATLDDFDWDKAAAYAQKLGSSGAQSVEHTLMRRGCISEAQGRPRPTYAGILLFGKDPGRFVRGAEITAARFNGDTMTDQFTKEDITGVLPEQLARVEGFLRDHLRKDVSLGQQMARGEVYEVPFEAARELVVNAVAHRDYSVDGDCVHVNLYRDRLEVISPGGLPGPITIDNMKEERFSRNPVIVQVLSDMRYIERLGYGVDRVISLMNERQLKAPVFEDSAASFRAVLFNQSLPVVTPAEESAAAMPYLAALDGVPINPRQEAALGLLHKGHSRITNKDLQMLYPDIHAETIRRDLADLVSRSVLRKLGEKRGSFYVLNA